MGKITAILLKYPIILDMRTFLFLIISFTLSTSAKSQSIFLDAIKEKWQHNKEYVLKCAILMPEEQYDFKPTEEVSTFREQIIHMMSNMNWITKDYLHGPKLKHNLKTLDPSKEELISILSQAFDNAATALDAIKVSDLEVRVDFFAGEKNILQMIELMDDHLSLHKGQLVVYLRLNDLAPPRFVGW